MGCIVFAFLSLLVQKLQLAYESVRMSSSLFPALPGHSSRMLSHHATTCCGSLRMACQEAHVVYSNTLNHKLKKIAQPGFLTAFVPPLTFSSVHGWAVVFYTLKHLKLSAGIPCSIPLKRLRPCSSVVSWWRTTLLARASARGSCR